MTHKSFINKMDILKGLFIIVCISCSTLVANSQSKGVEFPGGDEAYSKFLKENLVLPKHIEDGDAEGDVTIMLTVSKKGKILETKITQSLDSLCDAEGLRLVSMFPKLKAAKSKTGTIDSSKKWTIPFRNYSKASFINEDDNINDYIRKHLNKPVEAEDNGANSKVVVKLFINKEGKVTDAAIEESLSPACDKEALRLANSMPNWKPAQRDGENIDSYYKISIPFSGKESMPRFPGGEKMMSTFISKSLKYPTDAQRLKREGRVTVRFVVSKEGEIQEAEVVRKVYPSIDEEALRVINAMPNWEPGTIGGQPVPAYFSLPILFRLRNNSNSTPSRSIDSYGRPLTDRRLNRR